MDMTREEALRILSVVVHMLEEQYATDRVEVAVEMAINAIKMKDKIVAALAEILKGVDPECITDSSGDKHGYITGYERGLVDAYQIICKHIGEDLKL